MILHTYNGVATATAPRVVVGKSMRPVNEVSNDCHHGHTRLHIPRAMLIHGMCHGTYAIERAIFNSMAVYVAWTMGTRGM